VQKSPWKSRIGAPRLTVAVAIACLALGLLAGSAPASFHQIKIREVHEGGGAAADYVVLQMFAAGQTQVATRHLMSFDSAGNQYVDYVFPSNVANGQNQRTILVATQGMDDVGVNPDFEVPTSNFFPGPPGSVCYEHFLDSGQGAFDCVSIGAVAPPHADPSLVGTPVLSPAGLAPGQSVIRSISRGCKTLLEDSDDTDSSAADFALGTPSPRNNAMAPTEKSCSGGDGVASDAPNTKIKKRPKNRSDDTSPTFKFKSTETGSKFKCKLDRKKFRKCRSPKTYHELDPGKHTFKVKAIDADGNVDKTPAKDGFKVLP
jgi:hypothetical protein